ncbi:unnamed protein product [Brassica rapa subsp. trilocularis]
MASKLLQLKSKACEASKFVSKAQSTAQLTTNSCSRRTSSTAALGSFSTLVSLAFVDVLSRSGRKLIT